jgi:hypothetical protein
MLYCAPNAGSASVFTLARRMCGSSIPAAWAKAGAIILQGPHQGAQKSTSMGMSLRSRCLVKVTAVSSTGWPVNNGWWHCPQLGCWSSRAVGTRLTARQCGQTRCKGSLMRISPSDGQEKILLHLLFLRALCLVGPDKTGDYKAFFIIYPQTVVSG